MKYLISSRVICVQWASWNVRAQRDKSPDYRRLRRQIEDALSPTLSSYPTGNPLNPIRVSSFNFIAPVHHCCRPPSSKILKRQIPNGGMSDPLFISRICYIIKKKLSTSFYRNDCEFCLLSSSFRRVFLKTVLKKNLRVGID